MNNIHTEIKVQNEVQEPTENELFVKRLAKAAFGLVINDFRRYQESLGLTKEQEKFADMFGFVGLSETKRLFFDSLIWVFELHETEPRMSFGYACEVLGRDAKSFQQCAANAMHKELIELIDTIRVTCGDKSAKRAAEIIGEFVSVERELVK